jgi:hypothetical protein
MTRLTVRAVLGRVCALAPAGAALALVFAGPAAARAGNRIHVAVSPHAKKRVTYNVTVSGFAGHRAKAYLFVDYNPCASSVSAERGNVSPSEEVRYTVEGHFNKVSGWVSPVSNVHYACVFLVNPKNGLLLARGHVRYPVG